ncbi:MAG: HK97 gp10 family phage protein [Ruminococcus sp.]|nr:HK97 gp10 family phage protein [Ruminococcus sp.]
MADVIFESFAIEVMGEINDKINIALEESAGELESRAKRNTRVASSNTKNSWKHKVDTEKHEAVIGNPLENAIWEEFGTGEYALQGNGRKGGWVYKDDSGDYRFTRGKKPSRALFRAYTALKNKIEKHLQDSLKDL